MAEKREAIFRIGADSARLDGQLNTARSKLAKFGGAVKAELGGAFRGAFSQLKDVASIATVGGFAVAARSAIDFDKRLTRLRFASENAAAGLKMTATETAVLRDKLYDLSVASGVSTDELLTGVEKFVEETGNIEQAKSAMESFARVQATTGANMEDISKTAAKLNMTMGIQGKEFGKVFSILVEQSHVGSVELRNMAGLIAPLAAQFKMFGQGQEGVAEMGALFQVIARGFGSADEAATGFGQLMTQIVKKADKLKAIGVNVFRKDATGKEVARDMLDIIEDIRKKTGGRESVLEHIFGRQEAVRALRPLLASNREELESFIEAGMKSNVVSEQFGEYQKTAAFKIAQVTAEIKKLATEGLARHIDDIAKAFQLMGQAIAFIVDHKGSLLAIYAATKAAGIFGRLSGAMRSGGGLPGLAGAAAGAMPVFVVNMPGGGLGGVGGLGGLGGVGAGLGELGTAGKVLGMLSKGAGFVAGLGALFEGVQLLGDLVGKTLDEQTARVRANMPKLLTYEELHEPMANLDLVGTVKGGPQTEAEKKARREARALFDKAGKPTGSASGTYETPSSFQPMPQLPAGASEEEQRRAAAAWFDRNPVKVVVEVRNGNLVAGVENSPDHSRRGD